MSGLRYREDLQTGHTSKYIPQVSTPSDEDDQRDELTVFVGTLPRAIPLCRHGEAVGFPESEADEEEEEEEEEERE